MDTEKRQIWVDYIRVVATFCVMILHSAAPLLYNYKKLPVHHWMIANIYDSSVRMCVPLFFMLSGYLLLGKSEPLLTFFRKRYNKVVVPLIAWSFFFILWNSYCEKSSAISVYSFYSIIFSPAYYHLWFLYAIIGIYLFIPILRAVFKQSGDKLCYYYIIVWFFSVSIIPFFEKIARLNSKIDLLAFSGYSGYLVLGHLLGKVKITKRIAIFSGLLFPVCICATVIGTYLLTIRHEGTFKSYFYGFLSPNVVTFSVATFLLLKYTIAKTHSLLNEQALPIIRSLSACSFGIYLIHTVFLHFLAKGDFGFTLTGFEGNPIYSIPLTAVVVFILSYISIYILRMIPVIQKIAP